MEQNNNATLRQLHDERLARRQPAGVFIPHIPPPPTDADLEARRRVAEEPKVEEPKVEEPEVEEPEVEDCPVCLMPMDTKHTLQCGHEICGECPARMKEQNLGNGCVGLHPETGIKVIKCPVCRKEDMPTRDELIAELVRIRRGGRFSAIAPAPVAHAQPAQPRARGMNAEWRQAIAPAHNLPAVIPVLQPVIQHNQPPAPAPVAHDPVALQDGNWLRNQNFTPRRGGDLNLNFLHHHYPNLPANSDVAHWNIVRGHPVEDSIAIGQFLNAGNRIADGFICGVAGTRRYYHQQFFIPELTEGGVQARRLCNNQQCQGNHRSRTARRCPRGCGQFICRACGICNFNVCQPPNQNH